MITRRTLLTLAVLFVFCLRDHLAHSQDVRTINQRIAPRWVDSNHMTFQKESPDGSSVTVSVDLETGEMIELDEAAIRKGGAQLIGGQPPRSEPSSDDTHIKFVNESDETVQLIWVDMSGRREPYGRLKPGESRRQHTFSGHVWMVSGLDGTFYGSLIAPAPESSVRIKQTFAEPKRERRGGGRGNRRNQADDSQPDRYSLFGKGLQIRSPSDPEDWIKMDCGEMAERQLRSPTMSPDGKVLAVWKLKKNEAPDVTIIASSPPNTVPGFRGRAKVSSRPYRLPGDPYDEYELLTFDLTSAKPLPNDIPVIDFGYPRVRWINEHDLVVQKVDRGHQRFRLFVADPLAGTTDAVIDETADTFIWTIHGPKVPLLTYLDQTNEAIYASEKDGYRHLYLVDLDRTKPTTAITAGDWLVREIISVDETNRTLDLLVGEYHDNQDPYHRHVMRASFDGKINQIVTQGDGDHRVEFSPGRQFAVVTYSRVDQPPVHELRRVSDGQLIAELMRGQRVGDSDSQWALPKVFHAKGRDGKTEIWGNLHFPRDFDPSQADAYPVIEAIYAGPHDSHVPKRYRNSGWFDDLKSLGFVVVQIDGMGTANRSKAFHDVCWHNIKDAGFPDRIAWMKAAEKEYPALDLSRVGIYGTSAGGQNACGALLFHGEFYKAAYASCGCHDNRMDKASWNEQWMGYPVEDHYAENSNIDNADQLTGDLMLVVGELDTNVPPESTYRLVDALIKANKNFDFLLIPGMGHSSGGAYGQRRMREFFVESLRPGE